MRSILVILMMMIWTSLQTIKLCMWKLALCWVNRRNFRLPNYRDWKCCRVTGHQSPASGAAASYLFHTRNGPVSINQPKGELCIWLVSNNKRTSFMMCSATQQRKRGSISIPGYTLKIYVPYISTFVSVLVLQIHQNKMADKHTYLCDHYFWHLNTYWVHYKLRN